ncbi:MAG: hypothetical protein J7498_01325 [Sphingobium sp.]|nr:hypothetical protein [Sphingobium sp.]
MQIADLDTATPEQLAPILHAGLKRLGQLGREAAIALAALVEDDDADFDEAATWVEEVAAGALPG